MNVDSVTNRWQILGCCLLLGLCAVLLHLSRLLILLRHLLLPVLDVACERLQVLSVLLDLPLHVEHLPLCLGGALSLHYSGTLTKSID